MSSTLTIHKVLHVLLACANLTLFGVSAWTLGDPVVHAFYYNMTIDGDKVPNSSDTWCFFIVAIVSLVSSVQLLTVNILALWADAKRIYLFRVVIWYNLALISFTVAGLALIGSNREISSNLKFKSALQRIMEHKEKKYRESTEHSQFMDTVQRTVGCCGVINADVYVKEGVVPSSCGTTFGVGCLEKSLSYLDTRMRIFAGLHGIILILQIATLFISCFVPIKAKKSSGSWSPSSNRSRSLNYSRSRSPISNRSRSPHSLHL